MYRALRIAIIGTRGVPANYGGFETCAEQIGLRLVERGHYVTVYCRQQYNQHSSNEYKGMRLVKLPTIMNKYLDTIVHTLLAMLHALFQPYDVALCFNVGNSPLMWITRLVGIPTMLNVDGLDWQRDKWPPLAKAYIQWTESLAPILPTRFLTDSLSVQAYYTDRYGVTPRFIPYGSEPENIPPGSTLARFDLKPHQYVLFVGRLVKENCVDHLIDAFRQTKTEMKCVIVGDAPYSADYIASLRKSAEGDPRFVFTGYVFGQGYLELDFNAYVFVETAHVGGTHPALTEAMGLGNCVIFNDTAANAETVGGTGLPYEGQHGSASLKEVLQYAVDHPKVVADKGKLAARRAKDSYSWEKVVDEYERLCFELAGYTAPEHLQEKPAQSN